MSVMRANAEDSEAISLAIDVVGSSNDDHLANQLIEFLLGETDGLPKVSICNMILKKYFLKLWPHFVNAIYLIRLINFIWTVPIVFTFI